MENALQLTHLAPPVPHAWSDRPGSHVVPLQQPEVHEGHAGGTTHAWFMHVLPKSVQLTHATAPAPQLWSAVPGRHVPFAQHPKGQLAMLQLLASVPPAS
jgi:hypothetical protein